MLEVTIGTRVDLPDNFLLKHWLSRLSSFRHGDIRRICNGRYSTCDAIHSNGGHMAMRVAIDMAEEVAAIATIASQLPKNSQCARPSRPVPILMMFGTGDPILPFDGGPIAEGRGDVSSALETVDTWVQWNKLEDVQVRSRNVPNVDADDDSRIVSRVRERSAQGDSVVFYEILGGGHTEPSRSAIQGPLLQRVLGNQNNDIEMADAVWDFFKTRSRQALTPHFNHL